MWNVAAIKGIGVIAWYIACWTAMGIYFTSLDRQKEARVYQAEYEIEGAIQRKERKEAIEKLRKARTEFGLEQDEHDKVVEKVTAFAQLYEMQDFALFVQKQAAQASNSTKPLVNILDDKISQYTYGQEATANLSARNIDKLNEEVNELVRKWMHILEHTPHLAQLDQIPLPKFLELRKKQLEMINNDSSITNKEEYAQTMEEELLRCMELWNNFKKARQEEKVKKAIVLSQARLHQN